MGTERGKIVARIRKLLSVSEERGATEAEAVQAALLAQRLIADNDVSECDLADGEEPVEAVEARPTGRAWRGALAHAVADNFRCRTYARKRGRLTPSGRLRSDIYVVFFGRRVDAEAAAHVFDYLYAVGNRLAERARRESGGGSAGSAAYMSFAYGFVDGVESELSKQSQALLIVEPPEVGEEFDKKALGGRLPCGRGYALDDASRSDGFAAGRDAVAARRMDASGRFALAV